MLLLALAALVGVFHVHHEPSHDSGAPFSEVIAAAHAAGLDFLVLTDHADPEGGDALPGRAHAGLHQDASGGRVLVLVGVELGTADGHLLALDVQRTPAAEGVPARDAIREIHAQGGFAVVPHPFTHGGWHDWDAPFDGIEVQNGASDFRRLFGPLRPLRLVRHLFSPEATRRAAWVRPSAELARWEELLVAGRRVAPFAGADVHRNLWLPGGQVDPYLEVFRGVQMHCPEAPLEPRAVWDVLRSGRCRIRYRVWEGRASEAVERTFPSGRSELWLDRGRRVLEIGPLPVRRVPARAP
jgi:hypothetical protein